MYRLSHASCCYRHVAFHTVELSLNFSLITKRAPTAVNEGAKRLRHNSPCSLILIRATRNYNEHLYEACISVSKIFEKQPYKGPLFGKFGS